MCPATQELFKEAIEINKSSIDDDQFGGQSVYGDGASEGGGGGETEKTARRRSESFEYGHQQISFQFISQLRFPYLFYSSNIRRHRHI